MIPEISEFSYGFSLTNELVGWLSLHAAPVFPSLIQEGRSGGGYDVRFDRPGVPLYLQFKRADCMVRANVWEIRDYSTPLSIPFYRFKVTESHRSMQHELLLALDDGLNEVFYAAPRFHRVAGINDLWLSNRVATNSIFIRPSEIGLLDMNSHHVAYDRNNAWLCSAPKEVRHMDADGLAKRLIANLQAAKLPLSKALPEYLASAQGAPRRAQERRQRRSRSGLLYESVKDVAERLGGEDKRPEPIPLREAKPPTSDQDRLLRTLGEIANRDFGAQLIVVQLR